MAETWKKIYRVDMYYIDGWDIEEERPVELSPIDRIEGTDPTFVTTDLYKAYCYYRERERGEDPESTGWELSAEEIEVPDEIWYEWERKDSLSFEDYSKWKTRQPVHLLAWTYSHPDGCDIHEDVFGELLINKSRYFNMRAVCEKAGINYSTYRGFKNNQKPFSYLKKMQLLRQMHLIGNGCWDNDMDEWYELLSDGAGR